MEVEAILNTVDTAIRACYTEFTNNIYKMSPLADRVFSQRRVKPGKPILVPHVLSKGDTAEWADAEDAFTYAKPDTIFAPALNWCICKNTAFLPKEELDLCREEAEVVDLTTIALDDMLKGTKELVHTGLYTGLDTASPRQIGGLQSICSATNTYAMINRSDATYTEWRSKSTANTTLTKTLLDVEIDAIREFGDWPDMIVTTPTLESAMVNTWATPSQFYTSKMNPQISWKGLDYKGIPVLADPMCPSGDLYVLTMKYFKVQTPTAGKLFEIERFANESTFAGIRMRIHQMLQLVCREPKLQRRVSGITGISA